MMMQRPKVDVKAGDGVKGLRKGSKGLRQRQMLKTGAKA